MEIRKLSVKEHGKTRSLYEAVFAEDSPEFVEYYYTWKIRDNEIYVAEDEAGIHAMLHLNPFRMWNCGQIQTMHYIVAVATEEAYRHRGLMRSLLERAEKDMKDRGETWTFLMPASEKIYLPFGYRFFSGWRTGVLKSEELSADGREGMPSDAQVTCQPVQEKELGCLAAFVNEQMSRQKDLFVWRDAAYYQRLKQEQKCQDGDVMVICMDQRILGTFCVDQFEQVEIREVIFDPDKREIVLKALQNFLSDKGAVKVMGCQEGIPLLEEAWCPLMMGKVPGMPSGENWKAPWKTEKICLNEIV